MFFLTGDKQLSFNGSFHLKQLDDGTEFIFEFDRKGNGQVRFPVVIDHQKDYPKLTEEEIQFYALLKVNFKWKMKLLLDFVRESPYEYVKGAISRNEEYFFVYNIPVNKSRICTVEKLQSFFDEIKPMLDYLHNAVRKYEELDRSRERR